MARKAAEQGCNELEENIGNTFAHTTAQIQAQEGRLKASIDEILPQALAKTSELGTQLARELSRVEGCSADLMAKEASLSQQRVQDLSRDIRMSLKEMDEKDTLKGEEAGLHHQEEMRQIKREAEEAYAKLEAGYKQERQLIETQMVAAMEAKASQAQAAVDQCQSELKLLLEAGDKNVRSQLALELQAAMSMTNAEHEQSQARTLMEFQETTKEWGARFAARDKEFSVYKQENVNQLEELEERAEKKHNSLRQAMHVVGTALNLSAPLLESLKTH